MVEEGKETEGLYKRSLVMLLENYLVVCAEKPDRKLVGQSLKNENLSLIGTGRQEGGVFMGLCIYIQLEKLV